MCIFLSLCNMFMYSTVSVFMYCVCVCALFYVYVHYCVCFDVMCVHYNVVCLFPSTVGVLCLLLNLIVCFSYVLFKCI